MERDFLYVLLCTVLSSIGAYLFFACFYLKEEENAHKWFINHVIAYSSAIILLAVVLVLKLVLFDYAWDGMIMIQFVSIFVCIVMVMLAGAVMRKKVMKGTYVQQPFITVFLISLAVMAALLLFDMTYEIYYNIILTVFCGVVVLFTVRVYFYQRIRNNIGVGYIFGSSLSIIVCHLVLLPFSVELILSMELALMALVIVGLFIFYNNYYIEKIEDHILEVSEKSEQISRTNQLMNKIIETDEITTIENRTAFERRIVAGSRETYILLVNIRNFMRYNNLLGFNQGNELLKRIALAIKGMLPKEIEIYRFYSDKFILYLDSVSEQRVDVVIHRINRLLSNEGAVDFELELYYGGVLYEPKYYSTYSEKINHIITALEIASAEAKENDSGYYCYSESDKENFQNLINLEMKLEQAINQQNFEVFYQPQVDARTLEVTSYEALIRWKPDDMYVPPDVFIRMAEEKGSITAITYFVIHKVFMDVAMGDWIKKERVSINLSAVQLAEHELIEYIKEMTDKFPSCTEHIVFEITETTIFHDVEEIKQSIDTLKTMGFEFALDDFGAGYSSLYRFAKLNIEEVKFDKAFVQGIVDDEKLFITFQKSVELFKSFGMRIVAEGVETQQQLNLLKELDVDVYQGYFFFRPMPLEEILKEG